MHEAGQGSPQWALKSVTYFDHSTHRFAAGDIEIDGERIHAVRPPGTSTLERAIDASAYVCTPGLVCAIADRQDLAREPARLLRAGVTTAGTQCGTARQCLAAAAQAPLRLVTRLPLNGFAHARSRGRRPDARARAAELRMLERIAALLREHGGRLSLAVRCADIASAFDLVYVHNVAAEARLALGFELCDSPQSAQAFRERFYSSETQLLSFLQLLHPGVAVWGLSQLTRRDAALLVQSGAKAFGLHAQSYAAPRTRVPARVSSATAIHATRLAGLAGAPLAGVDADARVDAATIDAAQALGESMAGRIAPGMHADLCLFESSHKALAGCGSEAFLRLFEASEPAVVILAGSCAHDGRTGVRFAPTALHEQAVSARFPGRVHTGPTPGRAALSS